MTRFPERGTLAALTVHDPGWLKSGQKFDSSHDRGQPLVFPIGRGRVIKGWDEAPPSSSRWNCSASRRPEEV